MKHSHRASSHEVPAKPHPQGSSASAASAGDGPDLEMQIREAAYYRYLARGAEVGHDMEDWLQAESEFLDKARSDELRH